MLLRFGQPPALERELDRVEWLGMDEVVTAERTGDDPPAGLEAVDLERP